MEAVATAPGAAIPLEIRSGAFFTADPADFPHCGHFAAAAVRKDYELQICTINFSVVRARLQAGRDPTRFPFCRFYSAFSIACAICAAAHQSRSPARKNAQWSLAALEARAHLDILEVEQRDDRTGTPTKNARKQEGQDMARIRGLEAGTRSIFSAIALATTIFLGAGLAQAADSSDRITPPNPNDVAILRGLLALQHPALRQGAPAAAQAAPTVLPAVTTEPNSPNQDGKQATEGEACASPASGGRANCGSEAEASASRAGDFRASLDRAMAAAGYDGARL